VTGLVRTPLTLSLADLRAMQAAEGVHTLECAGNGRRLYALANTSGTQWERGAVGNAAWTGVRLSSLLERAGVAPEARHVWFEAADHATLPETPPFLRSIPLEKAMKDTLLAYAMNGAPLPAAHGGPLRAVVPGWFGMAWAKWVTRVRVEATSSDNHFMVRGYRYVYPGADPAQAPPVEEMVVKSVITNPLDGQKVGPGRIHVTGFAWAGTPEVAKVEVSGDGGRTWNGAGFVGKSAPHAWRSFAADVEMPAGRHVLMARATDAAGRTQPVQAKANASGYANNSIHSVVVHAG
jgi:DMSO/TMAO reductase YedYZ molybdopterin-dependent catalytic subunit